jgi:hypothetical protein
VALSAILTILDRRSMTAAPLHAFTSPTAGTGKSLLVDVAAMLATRQPMPVISQGRTEEELEKRLGAALLAGDTAIALDNCEHPLESSFLCQALTHQKLNIRMLGVSKNVETPVNAAIFATGNNLSIVGDLTRRALISALDAKCERPELRLFDTDILDIARTQRPPAGDGGAHRAASLARRRCARRAASVRQLRRLVAPRARAVGVARPRRPLRGGGLGARGRSQAVGTAHHTPAVEGSARHWLSTYHARDQSTSRSVGPIFSTRCSRGGKPKWECHQQRAVGTLAQSERRQNH